MKKNRSVSTSQTKLDKFLEEYSSLYEDVKAAQFCTDRAMDAVCNVLNNAPEEDWVSLAPSAMGELYACVLQLSGLLTEAAYALEDEDIESAPFVDEAISVLEEATKLHRAANKKYCCRVVYDDEDCAGEDGENEEDEGSDENSAIASLVSNVCDLIKEIRTSLLDNNGEDEEDEREEDEDDEEDKRSEIALVSENGDEILIKGLLADILLSFFEDDVEDDGSEDDEEDEESEEDEEEDEAEDVYEVDVSDLSDAELRALRDAIDEKLKNQHKTDKTKK